MARDGCILIGHFGSDRAGVNTSNFEPGTNRPKLVVNRYSHTSRALGRFCSEQNDLTGASINLRRSDLNATTFFEDSLLTLTVVRSNGCSPLPIFDDRQLLIPLEEEHHSISIGFEAVWQIEFVNSSIKCYMRIQ